MAAARPRIFAHRGFSGCWPENTLVAIRKAVEHGADGVEFDVRMTRDRVPVLMHDETLDRTTDGSGCVRDCTFASLRGCRARAAGQGGAPDIPSLAEVLAYLAGTTVELKVEIKEEGMASEVLRLLSDHGLSARSVILSFLPEVLRRVREIRREQATALATVRFDQGHYDAIRPWLDGVDFGLDAAAPGPPPFWDRARADGLTLTLWTINEPARIEAALALGPDCITTSFPDRLLARIQSKGPSPQRGARPLS